MDLFLQSIAVLISAISVVNGELLGTNFGAPGLDAAFDHVVIGGEAVGLTVTSAYLRVLQFL